MLSNSHRSRELESILPVNFFKIFDWLLPIFDFHQKVCCNRQNTDVTVFSSFLSSQKLENSNIEVQDHINCLSFISAVAETHTNIDTKHIKSNLQLLLILIFLTSYAASKNCLANLRFAIKF